MGKSPDNLTSSPGTLPCNIEKLRRPRRKIYYNIIMVSYTYMGWENIYNMYNFQACSVLYNNVARLVLRGVDIIVTHRKYWHDRIILLRG